MFCYRIVKAAHASDPLSGEGARLFGGRWNPPGWRCVYAAESRALAVLEMLVHLAGRARSLPFRLLTIEVPDELVSPMPALPEDWDVMPAGRVSQLLGEAWLRMGETVGLRVPSVIIPEESNVLLNPQTPGFDRVEVVDRRDFALDLRVGGRL
jgi:RES domain-containing protein